MPEVVGRVDRSVEQKVVGKAARSVGEWAGGKADCLGPSMETQKGSRLGARWWAQVLVRLWAPEKVHTKAAQLVVWAPQWVTEKVVRRAPQWESNTELRFL